MNNYLEKVAELVDSGVTPEDAVALIKKAGLFTKSKGLAVIPGAKGFTARQKFKLKAKQIKDAWKGARPGTKALIAGGVAGAATGIATRSREKQAGIVWDTTKDGAAFGAKAGLILGGIGGALVAGPTDRVPVIIGSAIGSGIGGAMYGAVGGSLLGVARKLAGRKVEEDANKRINMDE